MRNRGFHFKGFRQDAHGFQLLQRASKLRRAMRVIAAMGCHIRHLLRENRLFFLGLTFEPSISANLRRMSSCSALTFAGTSM